MPSLVTTPKNKRGRPKRHAKDAGDAKTDDKYRMTRESQSLFAMRLNQYWDARGIKANARIERFGTPRAGCMQEWVVRSDLGKHLIGMAVPE